MAEHDAITSSNQIPTKCIASAPGKLVCWRHPSFPPAFAILIQHLEVLSTTSITEVIYLQAGFLVTARHPKHPTPRDTDTPEKSSSFYLYRSPAPLAPLKMLAPPLSRKFKQQFGVDHVCCNREIEDGYALGRIGIKGHKGFIWRWGMATRF